ncbi:MAG: hypothetical protein JAY67_15580 [Candidatus Thiodiazotropha taylori]|nr:hypothetical protein [Candidatus Thiodiazotropha taylori]
MKKKIDILIEVSGLNRVSAEEILCEDLQVEIEEEDLGEWRLGENVVAWFAVIGALAGIVGAVVAVAEWARKNGGKGDVEIREYRVTSKETSVVTVSKWCLDDSERELIKVVEQIKSDINIRVS